MSVKRDHKEWCKNHWWVYVAHILGTGDHLLSIQTCNSWQSNRTLGERKHIVLYCKSIYSRMQKNLHAISYAVFLNISKEHEGHRFQFTSFQSEKLLHCVSSKCSQLPNKRNWLNWHGAPKNVTLWVARNTVSLHFLLQTDSPVFVTVSTL